eukprot:6190209-Pleurochrysis_carterae.AAC.4
MCWLAKCEREKAGRVIVAAQGRARACSGVDMGDSLCLKSQKSGERQVREVIKTTCRSEGPRNAGPERKGCRACECA